MIHYVYINRGGKVSSKYGIKKIFWNNLLGVRKELIGRQEF